jgi:hypothetical protein
MNDDRSWLSSLVCRFHRDLELGYLSVSLSRHRRSGMPMPPDLLASDGSTERQLSDEYGPVKGGFVLPAAAFGPP